MGDEKTIYEWLGYRARHTPDFIYCIYEDRKISLRTLRSSVGRLASGLSELGVTAGQHVAVMLGNHPDHIFTIFALAELGAVWVPINVNLRGPSLDFVFEKSAPSVLIADSDFWNQLVPVLAYENIETVIVRNARNIVIRPTE